LKCREFIEFLDDYLAGGLPPRTQALFAEHLSRCPSCVAYMKTYRETARMARAAGRSDDARARELGEDMLRAILAACAGSAP
jgi:predicted anti-sigma-YlaC factor YlaD